MEQLDRPVDCAFVDNTCIPWVVQAGPLDSQTKAEEMTGP